MSGTRLRDIQHIWTIEQATLTYLVRNGGTFFVDFYIKKYKYIYYNVYNFNISNINKY